MRDSSGALHSLQFIKVDGSKKYLTGGRTRGCYFGIGKPEGVLCIVEGFATGASIHEATGYAVAVAFDAGNLLSVARELRRKFPALRLILCADDDAATDGNPGLTKAREAARSIGGLLAIPEFGAERPPGATDFNDLCRYRGENAVRECLENAQNLAGSSSATATPTTGSLDWPEPQSLDRTTGPSGAFPLESLPTLIREAVEEYQRYGQQPIALVASSALAAVSLATQGLADVARDAQLHGPTSLNFLIVAGSGERKTAADRAFTRALADWERERSDALRPDIVRRAAELTVWTAERDGLLAAIRTAVKNKPAQVEDLRRRLIEHEGRRPTELVAPRLRYEDVNPQSLAFMLATGYPSAALWSDEGGIVTGSRGMSNESFLGFLAALNRLWDGGELHHDRKQAQSVHVEGRRLTVSLMVQPAVLAELSQRGGGLTRGSGFLARYLIAAPDSTMGTRLYREPPEDMPALARFHDRVRACLEAPLTLDGQGRLNPPLLSPSSDAFMVWRAYHDEIERELSPLGEFAEARDFASKSAENAARIAACLHLFEGRQGAIQAQTMRSAVCLARWYLREALRLLGLLEEPQEWTDARLLDSWLREKGVTSRRDILHRGPAQLRDRARRDAAIRVLKDLDRARLRREGKQEVLVPNPHLQATATATSATPATPLENAESPIASVATVAAMNGQCRDSVIRGAVAYATGETRSALARGPEVQPPEWTGGLETVAKVASVAAAEDESDEWERGEL
jgi:putative DNA primase/helicase